MKETIMMMLVLVQLLFCSLKGDPNWETLRK